MLEIVIKEFAAIGKQDTTWRVDWFGHLERDPQLPTEAKIHVILSQLDPEYNGRDVTADRAVLHESRTAVAIGVGQLPIIKIGSLWKNGILLPTLCGQPKSLDVEISETMMRSVAPSRFPASSCTEWLFPSWDHQIKRSVGKGHRLDDPIESLLAKACSAKCVVLSHPQYPHGIIIPTIEIIRFYFCFSTLLAKAIFNGTFQTSPGDVYNPKRSGYDPANAECFVTRRKHVSDEDCKLIARIISSETAAAAVQTIYNSLIITHTNRRGRFPDAGFPFKGKTTLMARCKSVCRGRGLLVLSLQSCSAPLPFRTIVIGADNDSTVSAGENDIPREERKVAFAGVRSAVLATNGNYQSEREPDADSERIHCELQAERLLGFREVEIKKASKDGNSYKSGYFTRQVEEFSDEVGTGDGVSGSKVVPGSLQENALAADPPGSFETVKAIMERLNGQPNVIARLRPSVDTPGLFEAKVVYAGRRKRWSYIDRRNKRLRRFMVLDIKMSGSHYCLIEIERRKGSSEAFYAALIWSVGNEYIDNIALERLLDECAFKEGVLSQVSFSRFGFECQRLRHSSTGDAGHFARKIIRVMTRELIFSEAGKLSS